MTEKECIAAFLKDTGGAASALKAVIDDSAPGAQFVFLDGDALDQLVANVTFTTRQIRRVRGEDDDPESIDQIDTGTDYIAVPFDATLFNTKLYTIYANACTQLAQEFREKCAANVSPDSCVHYAISTDVECSPSPTGRCPLTVTVSATINIAPKTPASGVV